MGIDDGRNSEVKSDGHGCDVRKDEVKSSNALSNH